VVVVLVVDVEVLVAELEVGAMEVVDEVEVVEEAVEIGEVLLVVEVEVGGIRDVEVVEVLLEDEVEEELLVVVGIGVVEVGAAGA
jgi:hypothetical protein